MYGVPESELSDYLRPEGLFLFIQALRSVYKELHADHETGAADNK